MWQYHAIPHNVNYVPVESNWNCLKVFCVVFFQYRFSASYHQLSTSQRIVLYYFKSFSLKTSVCHSKLKPVMLVNNTMKCTRSSRTPSTKSQNDCSQLMSSEIVDQRMVIYTKQHTVPCTDPVYIYIHTTIIVGVSTHFLLQQGSLAPVSCLFLQCHPKGILYMCP